MTKKYSIYTVVIDNYDSPKPPPRAIRQEIDFFLVSNRDITVNGWQTIKILGEPCHDPIAMSRRLKMLYFTEFQESGTSLYLDGNISPSRRVIDLFKWFESTGRPMGLFPHPKRSSAQEEANYCVRVGKISSSQTAQSELASYESEGFRDEVGLFHGGVIFRKSNSEVSLVAMNNWNRRFEQWRTRDQLSLPVSLWASGVEPHIFDQINHPLNKYFYFHSHKNTNATTKIVSALARRVKRFHSYQRL